MASLIPGYNYDIFISYRQKDNKGDRWVSEFVDALKDELESTFKEEISVYFDINPHDGLLETHDVDESLKEKLKCLVFIPIISRTYCDTKSFAWEHEFKVFVDQASNDQFGLKVKLPNGNVASRVLPVQIHDLDKADIKLCESVLGGVLRGIEFIYKESGIDKPLAPDDDETKNLNNTKYKIQIVKVAHAIKEIVGGLKSEPLASDKEKTHLKEYLEEANVEDRRIDYAKPFKLFKRKLILGIAIIVVLIFVAVSVYPKIFKSSKSIEKSIAVLPFLNYSEDQDIFMSDGITESIINHLYKIASLDKVIPLTSVLVYKGADKQIPQIASELKVNYILEGTYRKIGDSVKVIVTLFEATKEKFIWQEGYDKLYNDIYVIQSEITLQIADLVKAYLTSSEQQNINKVPTSNQEAYELLQKAIYSPYSDSTTFYAQNSQQFELVLKVIDMDPHYADAYAYAGSYILSSANYGGGSEMKSAGGGALQYFKKALEIDPNNGFAHYGLAQLNDWYNWDYIKADEEFLIALDLLPNNPMVATQYGEFLIKMNRKEEAKSVFSILEPNFNNEFREIRRNIISGEQKEAYHSISVLLESFKRQGYIWAGDAYIWLEEYDSALFYLESVKPSNDPEILIPRFQACLALVSYKANNIERAQKIIDQLIARSDTSSAMSPDFFIGWYYSGIGKIDSAIYWLEKAYHNRSPEMPWIKVDPVLKTLKNDNRYWDLYERTGHKAYDEYMSGIKNK